VTGASERSDELITTGPDLQPPLQWCLIERLLAGGSALPKEGGTDSHEARSETIEVLLHELERAMDKQFQTIDSLDSKAGQLFGVASLATALMMAFAGIVRDTSYQTDAAQAATTTPTSVTVGAFVLAILMYVATIYCLVRAFRVEAFRLPLKVDRKHIIETYLPLSKHEAKAQLLSNYIEQMEANSAIVETKAWWIRWSLYLLGTDVVYLIIFTAVGVLTTPS
jgi:hypothetical protein